MTVARLCKVLDGSRKRARQIWKGFAFGVAVVWLSSAQAINLPESTSKLVYAGQIEREYIAPLGMKGKPASYALTTLLGKGFRCDLRLVSPIGLDEPPLIACLKSTTEFGPLCNDLQITVRFRREPTFSSREELYQHLDLVRVESAMAFCPYPDEVSADFVTARDAAERELSRQLSILDLLGSAQDAYRKLLMQGYYCGFLVDQIGKENNSNDRPQVVCTTWRTQIRYCHEAKLVMDADWPVGTTSLAQLYALLPYAQITAVHSSCVIPNLRLGGRKL